LLCGVLELDRDWRHPNGLVGAQGDSDSRFVESTKNIAADRIFDVTNAVISNYESNGNLDPVVGQTHIRFWTQTGTLDEIATLEFSQRLLPDLSKVHGTFGDGVKDNVCL